MYLDSTMLLLIPGLLLALFAQSRVKATYAKYARVPIASRLTGAEAARRILRDSGNDVVQIQPVQGQLTDHYDPKSEVLRLSEGVYDTASVSAVGIAAHEAGHAMQKRDDYAPLGLRTLVVPTVRIGSTLSMPIFIIGLLMSFRPLIYAGIVLFSLTVVFSLITLPVEFNASKRAVAMLRNSGVVTTAEEEKGVRAVLQLLRLVLLARGGSRRND